MNPAPQPDPVLSQLEWVRGLCLRLVRDVAAADDLVQEVWLVAQKSLPSHVRDEGRLRGWLAGAARNLVRNLGRSESHRAAREQRFGSEARLTEPGPAGDDLVARSEVLKLVAEGVLALEEPFRRTMLLRWFEGHTPKEIAAIEGVQEGSVHSRLHRGCERLRAWMTRHYPGARHDWALALVPVASRALLLEGGRGWLTVQAGAAAAAVLTVGAGTILWMGGGSAAKEVEAADAESIARVPLTPVDTSPAAPAISLASDSMGGRDALMVAPATESIPATDELEVRVLTYAGAPAQGVILGHRRGAEDNQAVLTDIWLETNETGRASIEWSELGRREALSGSFEAQIAALDFPTTAYTEGDSEVTLTLPPTATVIIDFEDARGAPVSFEGSVNLLVPQTERPSRNSVTASVHGARAVFDHVTLGMRRLNLQPRGGWLQEIFFAGPVNAGEVVRVRCTVKENWTVLTGRAIDASGAPVPGVQLGFREPNGKSASARAGGDGLFTFALPRRSVENPYQFTYRVRSRGPFDYAHGLLLVDVSTGEAQVDIGDLTLTPLAPWYAGRVVNAAGLPVEGASVHLTARAADGHRLLGGVSKTTGMDGRFDLPEVVLGLLEPRVSASDVGTMGLELKVRSDGFVDWSSALPRGSDLDLRIELARATVVSARATTSMIPESELTIVARQDSAPDGQRSFFGLRYGDDAPSCQLGPGTWTVAVYHQGYMGLPLFQWEPLTLGPGTESAILPEVSLDAHVRRKTLRFESESGETIEGVDLQLEDVTTSARGNVLTQDGTVSLFLPNAPVRMRARGRAQQGLGRTEASWVCTGDGDEVITLSPR